MARIRINNQKNFLPFPASKGSTKERLQKARLLNLRFYENLQDSFQNNLIAPRTFGNILKKTLGAKIKLNIIQSPKEKVCDTKLAFNQNAISDGYLMCLQFHNDTNKIHKKNAIEFLKASLDVFNYALNPKILARIISMFNKGYKTDEIEKFFMTNILKKSELKKDALNTFLKNKTLAEQIETLQLLRYKLLFEQSNQNALLQIDKSIEKYNHLKYIREPDYYNPNRFEYEQKLELLNKKLSELMKKQRIQN